MQHPLLTPVEALPGVGEKRIQTLHDHRFFVYADILLHFPYRYENWMLKPSVYAMQDGNIYAFSGKIQEVQTRATKSKPILEVRLEGPQGMLTALWFNQNFLKNRFKIGTSLTVLGKYQQAFHSEMIVQKWRFGDYTMHHLEPIYRSIASIGNSFWQKWQTNVLKVLKEHPLPSYIPYDVLREHHLYSLTEALETIHFGRCKDDIEKAKFSLCVYDFTLFRRWAQQLKPQSQNSISHYKASWRREKLYQNLGFSLTKEQEKAISEIDEDMIKQEPMNRLLQGDVGSGKTLVAIVALLKAVDNGYQGAFLAPTSILAEQHYQTLHAMLSPLGLHIAFLHGGMSEKEKKQLVHDIGEGRIDIVCGTHALLQENVFFSKLGLVVIDEQHRFGVRQREHFFNLSPQPDILSMSATPIPRTLALTSFKESAITTIKEKPAYRKPIQTLLISESKRHDMYRFIAKRVDLGEQIYWVCPLIEENETLSIKNAEEVFSYLKTQIFPEAKLALLHGRIKKHEKTQIMDAFAKGAIDILVSTTVIEVGVDVANATVIVIENAERFGLAQLHQLRGRVGRGTKKSYCILLSNSESNKSLDRLKTLVYSQDGFALAEYDLEHRGAGEMIGTRQHGLAELLIANWTQDKDAFEIALQIDPFIQEDTLAPYLEWIQKRITIT